MSKPEIYKEDDPDSPQKSLLPPVSPKITPIDGAKPVSFFRLFQGTYPTTKAYFLAGFLSSVGNNGIYSLIFLLMGQIYAESSEEDEDDYDMYHEICKIVFCWTFLSFAMLCFSYSSTYCFTRVSQEIGQLYRYRYFHAILHKDSSYFDTHNVSEMPTHMTRDCQAIEAGTGDRLMFFIDVICYTVFGMAIVFSKSPQLFLVGFSIVPMELLGSALMGYGVILGGASTQKAYAKAGAIAEEALSEVKTVASCNAQEHVCERYARELEESQRVTAKIGFLQGLGLGILWMSWMLIGAAIFWVSAQWISSERTNWLWGDTIEGSDTITVFWIVSVVSLRLSSMAPGLAACIEAKAAGGRALKFINEPVQFVSGTQQRCLEGQIEFVNVHFAYPRRPDELILRGITFVCEKGEKTAIVGESGVGKSTIIQLMERFYEPSAGAILYDGVPAAKYDIRCLRKQVGYVSQEPVLFSLSINENILLGNPLAPAEEVIAAAKEANAFNFIEAMQDGFLTHVGVRGSKLSGGQKQRIAIARAMVKKPKILLLDEATSALDNESEEVVLRALNAIHERRRITMVSVAQKLTAIRNSDKIVVLRNGIVEEEGNHETLMSREGLYSMMCVAQSSNSEEQTGVETKNRSDVVVEGEPNPQMPNAVSEDSLNNFPVSRVRALILKNWPLLLIVVITACISGTMTPLFGFAIAKLTGYISESAGEMMEDKVAKFSETLLVLSTISFSSFAILNWSISLLSARVTQSIRRNTFLKMLHLDAEYFDENSSTASVLSSSLTSDAEKINNVGGSLLSTYLSVSVSFVLGIAISIYWQWKLGLVMVALIPIESFLCVRGYFVLQQGITHPQHQSATSHAVESILNVKTIAAYEMQEYMEGTYSSNLQRIYDDTRIEGHWNSFAYGLSTTAVCWGLALSFWYGAYLKKNDQAESEDVNIAIFSALMTILGIVAASTFAPDLQEGSRATAKLFDIIDRKAEIDSTSKAGSMAEILGEVEFVGVGFRYKGTEYPVLQNVSFKIPVGKHIGITGASGSGKTTIAQLLLRFYDPTEGTISIDGVDIRQYNIRHLRASIAMVGQEPVLFSGTVRSNVDFGLGKSDEEVKQALVRASIPRFAEELDKEVGSRGSLVSGGQKQRIAIARAILRSPKILVLDEATSALDTKTEMKILSALEYAGQGRTVLVIAHRLSTIEKCDEIFVMDAGQIKERGTHEELMRKEGSIYQKLSAAAKH